MNNNKKTFGDVLKDNLQKILLVIVSILFVLQGMFTIAKKDTTIVNILGSMSITAVVGITISNLYNRMGIKKGLNSPKTIASCEAYGKSKEKATPNLDKLSSWCEYKNSKELELAKKDIIQKAGLKWKAFKLGYYDEHKDKLSEEQKKSLEKAKNYEIDKITQSDLLTLSIATKNRSGKKFGKSIEAYNKENFLTDVGSKLAIGIIGGLYGLMPLITEENATTMIAGLIWNAMQLAVMFVFGLLKYSNAISFIEDEFRQDNIILKTEYLNEFNVTMMNNPKVIEEFDEEEEINDYINSLVEKKIEEKEKENDEQSKEDISN